MARRKPISRPIALGLLATPFIIVLIVVATVYQTQLTTKVATSSVTGRFQVRSSSSVLTPGNNVVLSWGRLNEKGGLVKPGLLDRIFKQEKIVLVVNGERFTLAARTQNDGQESVTIPAAVNSLLSEQGAAAFFELSAVDKNNKVTTVQTSSELVEVKPATKEESASSDTGTGGSSSTSSSSGSGGSSNDSSVANTPTSEPVSDVGETANTTSSPTPSLAPNSGPTPSPTPPSSSSDTLPDYTAVGLQTLGTLKAGVMNGYDAKVSNYNTSGRGTATTLESTAGAWLDIDNNGEFEASLNTDTNNGYTPPLGNIRVADILWRSAGRGIAGTHRLKVCADIHNVIREAREDNNCSEISFTVKP